MPRPHQARAQRGRCLGSEVVLKEGDHGLGGRQSRGMGGWSARPRGYRRWRHRVLVRSAWYHPPTWSCARFSKRGSWCRAPVDSPYLVHCPLVELFHHAALLGHVGRTAIHALAPRKRLEHMSRLVRRVGDDLDALHVHRPRPVAAVKHAPRHTHHVAHRESRRVVVPVRRDIAAIDSRRRLFQRRRTLHVDRGRPVVDCISLHTYPYTLSVPLPRAPRRPSRQSSHRRTATGRVGRAALRPPQTARETRA